MYSELCQPIEVSDPEFAEVVRQITHDEVNAVIHLGKVYEVHPSLKSQRCLHLGARIRREVNQGIGRNDPCPCGSGKKYKKCCL